MAYFSKFFMFCILLLKIFLVSTQKHNFTFLVAAGYRPREHTLIKHLVSISRRTSTKDFGTAHLCGGSILTSRAILTAASCMHQQILENKMNLYDIQIVAKTPNRLVGTWNTEIRSVDKIIVHPFYNHMSSFNDIAIVLLTSDIIEDGYYALRLELTDRPARLGTKCTAVGWGSLFEDGPLASDALYVDIYILPKYLCRNQYSNFVEGMLCAGDMKDLQKDVCQTDSGGPLICNGEVAGIVSFGNGCGDVPGVYTDVWYYRDWIMDVVSGANNIISYKVYLLPLLVWIVG